MDKEKKTDPIITLSTGPIEKIKSIDNPIIELPDEIKEEIELKVAVEEYLKRRQKNY